MYGIAAGSILHVSAAMGAYATSATRSATAVAASGSSARAMSRFQNACRNAAARASARASSGTAVVSRADGTAARDRVRLQRNALARRADPLRDLHRALRRTGETPLGPGVLRRPRRPLGSRDRP